MQPLPLRLALCASEKRLPGSFFFWPRSHRAAHEYFKQHPECINPNEHGHPGWNVETLSAMAGGYPEQPREWLGQKGDTILCECSSSPLSFPCSTSVY